MKISKNTESEKDFDPIVKLIQVIQKDPEIREKVKKLLHMESYQRRAILNSWLEQLRIYHASENMLTALSSLFDDKIVEEVLALINDRKI